MSLRLKRLVLYISGEKKSKLQYPRNIDYTTCLKEPRIDEIKEGCQRMDLKAREVHLIHLS